MPLFEETYFFSLFKNKDFPIKQEKFTVLLTFGKVILLTKEKGCKIEKSKVNSLIRFESCKHRLAEIYI